MALQMNYYHTEFGITFYNAYWKINPNNGIIGGKSGIRYTIEAFKNNESSKVIKGFTFSFIPDLSVNAPNFIVQAYNNAKSLPLLNGSVDV